jgi:hypothetical protein
LAGVKALKVKALKVKALQVKALKWTLNRFQPSS